MDAVTSRLIQAYPLPYNSNLANNQITNPILGQQWDQGDFELERFLHLYALNRRILMTPFHNMALMSPATTEADVDRHTEVFKAAVEELFGQ